MSEKADKKTKPEVSSSVVELRKEYHDYKVALLNGKEKNTAKLKAMRKKIADLLRTQSIVK